MVVTAEAPAWVRPATSRVAVVRTSPATVLDDVERVMQLAAFTEALPRAVETLLKVNISWQRWYPGCSTSPWQLEGVARALQRAGYGRLFAAHNGTVVVDSHEGERGNRHEVVQRRYGVPAVHLGDDGVAWRAYEPRGELAVLDRIYPDGILVPDLLRGRNVVHLPTLKTHVFTTMTGAMKNAFGGLLGNNRHWAHADIHAVLCDLLLIQRELHPGVFAVMDGAFAGDGPGPRATRPHVTNLLLASDDPVAIDAVAARLMGFDPLSIPFLRRADERALGHARGEHIEVAGIDIRGVNLGFSRSEDTLASRGQKLIYWGPLKPLEKALLRSRAAPLSYVASDLYHNKLWYPFVGWRRARTARRTPWGRLFERYADGTLA